MSRRRPWFWLSLACALAAADAQTNSGSAACAGCHRAIYDSYRVTPMARSARKLDPATTVERFDRASFVHAASGFRYRVSVQGSSYMLGFENAASGLSGAKRLAYAVGSGERAFSYLIADEDFLFEAPIAYYTASQSWGLAPGYDRYSYPFLGRPIVPGCLSCHSSGVQADSATLNRYSPAPFLEGGVSCERCHGDGARHIAKMNSGEPGGGAQIVNPPRLPAVNRDSICAQCHLSGDVRVMRPGADWRTFQPGERLADSQTVFVRSAKTGGVTVTGHVENLASSACKRISGDRMWCGSCHDPHKVPAPGEAAAWFRSRCLSCHAEKGCSETKQVRARTNDNCVACHMPKRTATDAEHVVLTDHSIPRRPRGTAGGAAAGGELVAFDGRPAPRDVALAYAIAALSDATYRDRARTLLEQAVKGSPEDVDVIVSLAEIYRNDGRRDAAQELYERALALDSRQLTAQVGLGAIAMERGQYAGAIRLWTAALAQNSGLELVRLNLSLAQWRYGDRPGAEASLRRAIEVNPSFAPARDTLRQIERAPPK